MIHYFDNRKDIKRDLAGSITPLIDFSNTVLKLHLEPYSRRYPVNSFIASKLFEIYSTILSCLIIAVPVDNLSQTKQMNPYQESRLALSYLSSSPPTPRFAHTSSPMAISLSETTPLATYLK